MCPALQLNFGFPYRLPHVPHIDLIFISHRSRFTQVLYRHAVGFFQNRDVALSRIIAFSRAYNKQTRDRLGRRSMRVLEKLSKGLSDAIKPVAKSSAKTLRSVKTKEPKSQNESPPASTDANLLKLNQRFVFFMLHRKGAIIFPDVTAKSNFLSVVNP